MESPGLGGIAANRDFVIISGRTLRDSADLFQAVSPLDGSKLWSYSYPAKGALDYGNSPRATPLIHNGWVYTLGAMGNLACLELKTGQPRWEMSFKDEFEIKEDPKWGFCASPLIVENNLIVHPGAPDAAMVALDPLTGKIRWKSPGKPPGYGSWVIGNLGGQEQVVGHDSESLGGWDPRTGKRLWRILPAAANDFNVPTPLVSREGVWVSTENNGTRFFRFGAKGQPVEKPAAQFRKLSPDTHTPLLIQNRVLGISKRLFCLDSTTLEPLWDSNRPEFGRYGALVGNDQKVMAITLDGDVLLFSIQGQFLGKTTLFEGERGLYSHPAFVGSTMFVRGTAKLACFSWK